MNDPQTISPPHALTAADVRQMLGAALQVLRQHKTEVDALNVFPVPDGDTGANMTLTMQSAWKEIENKSFDHAGSLLQAFALGAIRGARGNSGVILSQILRGMAEALGDEPVFDVARLARGFRQGQKVAYQGVMQPVEGTILTVIRAVADAAEHAAALSHDPRFLFETILSKARETLAQTPEMLPVLKQAGVVDAGGQGLVYVIEGMARYVAGETIPVASIAPTPTPPQPHLEALGDEWGYDIQYLIYNAEPDETTIRQRLTELGGESIVVGRAGNITKVHVHGEDPGPFLSYGASLGHLDDIVVENMTLQTLRRRGEWRDDAPSQEETASPEPDFCTNVVAVAPGAGFAEIFRSLGACQVVSGGQTMNPSTEELLQALNQVAEPEVIVLPNNKNIVMAANQAAALADKQVYVVPTRSPAQGIAAMFAFSPELSAAENAQTMQAQAEQVHTIEVTTAVRDAHINGVKVNEKNAIALLDGDLCCSGADPETAALQAIDALLASSSVEIVTIYYGQPSNAQRAQQLARAIQQKAPDLETEVLSGGQPYYHYILSLE